jgi:hypothetical protein
MINEVIFNKRYLDITHFYKAFNPETFITLATRIYSRVCRKLDRPFYIKRDHL